MNAFDIYEENKDIEININLRENTVFELNFSYITYEVINLKINIIMTGNNNKGLLTIHSISKEKGKSKIEVNGIVKEKTTGNNLEEIIKIINDGEEENEIIPNMMINTDDCLATHGAMIGQFRDEDINYLEKKGLSEYDSIKLLERGFLTNNLKISDTRKNDIKEKLKKWEVKL